MPEPRAQRTLVKSPPELWAEVSDVSTLARHLGEFGEIRITRLEAETTVVWEGDTARGTVELAPSGWGTKVTITAEAVEVEPEPVADEPEPEPEPVAEVVEPEVVEVEVEPMPVAATTAPAAEPKRRGFFARLFGRKAADPLPALPAPVAVVEPEPEPEPEPVAEVIAPEPEPIAEPVIEGPIAAQAAPFDAERMEAVLVSVLDDLGSAHHRPFSRG
jgi:hypothetical protein